MIIFTLGLRGQRAFCLELRSQEMHNKSSQTGHLAMCDSDTIFLDDMCINSGCDTSSLACRVYPYAFYFCRHCPPSDLCFNLDFQESCKKVGCYHSRAAHFCWWNKYIANPIKSLGYNTKGQLAMAVLKREILDHTVIRRTKIECADVLALPPRYLKVSSTTLYKLCFNLAHMK